MYCAVTMAELIVSKKSHAQLHQNMEETEIISSLIDQQLPRGRLSGDIVERPVLIRHVPGFADAVSFSG